MQQHHPQQVHCALNTYVLQREDAAFLMIAGWSAGVGKRRGESLEKHREESRFELMFESVVI